MGEKREEGFVFSFVFFFILPSSDSLLRYFVTQYASAQNLRKISLFFYFREWKLKIKNFHLENESFNFVFKKDFFRLLLIGDVVCQQETL